LSCVLHMPAHSCSGTAPERCLQVTLCVMSDIQQLQGTCSGTQSTVQVKNTVMSTFLTCGLYMPAHSCSVAAQQRCVQVTLCGMSEIQLFQSTCSGQQSLVQVKNTVVSTFLTCGLHMHIHPLTCAVHMGCAEVTLYVRSVTQQYKGNCHCYRCRWKTQCR
jgi:hypothetical protein